MKAEKAEDEHHDDDEADEIDYAVHFVLPSFLIVPVRLSGLSTSPLRSV